MLLYGSIRSAPIGEPGATFTIQNYIKAYFDREFYFLFLNSIVLCPRHLPPHFLDRNVSRLG